MSESAILGVAIPILLVLGIILMIVPPILRARRRRNRPVRDLGTRNRPRRKPRR